MTIKKRILALFLTTSMVLGNMPSNFLYDTLHRNDTTFETVQAAEINYGQNESVDVDIIKGTVTNDTYSDDYIQVKYSTNNLTDTKYQINNCTPVPFTDTITLTIGMDTDYGEETTISIWGTSIINPEAKPLGWGFTYTRDTEPLLFNDTINIPVIIIIPKSDFETAPYIYLYSRDGSNLVSYSGTWPGEQMFECEDYYVYVGYNAPLYGEYFAYVSTDTFRYPPDSIPGLPVNGYVEFDKENKEMIDLNASIQPVKIQYQTEDGKLIKEITRKGTYGTQFVAYAPKYLFHNSTYVLTSTEDSYGTAEGWFVKEERTIVFTYKEVAESATTPSLTATPTQTPTTAPPTITPTDNTSTNPPTETPTQTPTTVPPTETPTQVPTTKPPTETPTDTAVTPKPTPYVPLSPDGTSHTVTLHPRGGNIRKTVLTVNQGSTYGLLPVPSRTGYTFEGWYTSMTDGQTPVTSDSIVNLAENQDLYAKWTANTYTLTFNANGGETETDNLTVTYGQPYPNLPVPTKENALFSGWYAEDGSYISEYNICNTASDLTLIAEWQTNFQPATIEDLSFSFANTSIGFSYEDNYRPGLEIFQYIYGNTLKAKKMYTQQSVWAGSCFGIAATTLFFHVGTTSNLQYKDFNKDADAVSQLDVKDTNSTLNLDLTKLIEVMHVIQQDSYILSKRNENLNQLDTLCEKVKDAQNGKGNPILIYIWGVDDKGNAGGHAVLGYKMEGSLLYIYDPNYPNEVRYITIKKDESGNSTWSYKLNKQYDWGTGQEGNFISYITYEDLKQGWEQCRMLQYAIGNSNTNSLILSTKNANIYSGNGTLMASIIEGELESKYEDICKIIPNVIVSSQENASLEIHLPAGEYIIENIDPAITEFTAEMMNLQQCATVTTQARKITIAVNDEERVNSVICHANESETYSITLESSMEGDSELVTRSGNGNSAQYVGVSQSEGCVTELINITQPVPTARPVFPISISTTEGGIISCTELGISTETQQSFDATAGQTLSFTITPKTGYALSNVFVDDTNMGAISSYPLENISSGHTIRAVFTKQEAITTQNTFQNFQIEKIPSYKYTGKGITPVVTVYIGNMLLEEDKDYVLCYRNNKNIGTGYVDVVGIFAYAGLEASASFAILPSKGKTFTIGGLKYKLTSESSQKLTLVGVHKKSVSSVTIPKKIKLGTTTYKITKINARAFQNCTKLKSITISSTTISEIGKNALKGIHRKAVITVPASQYKAYSKLLKNKGQSKTVKIKK